MSACEQEITPCECARLITEFKEKLNDSANQATNQEKVIYEYAKEFEKCNSLSEKMGQEVFLNALQDCDN